MKHSVYIEFGAGKGYLSGMLAEAFHAQKIVLMDNKSFRQKADRCEGFLAFTPVPLTNSSFFLITWKGAPVKAPGSHMDELT
jgi:hypothetical protein